MVSKIRQLNEQKFCGWCGSAVKYKDTWVSKCTSCKYENYINPKPCSNTIIVKNGLVLLARRAIEPALGKFDLPGGFADITDQSMEETVLREVKEELGITSKDLGEVYYFTSKKSPIYNWQNTGIQNLSFFYVCKLKNDSRVIKVNKEENSEIIWITKNDLPNIDFAWDIDRQMLIRYFEENS